jgi:hypothetical protein
VFSNDASRWTRPQNGYERGLLLDGSSIVESAKAETGCKLECSTAATALERQRKSILARLC